MSKKLISVFLCMALVGTIIFGCGQQADTDNTASDDSTAAEITDKAGAETEPEEEGDTAAEEDIHIEIVSKGFQTQFWQAVLKGAESKAQELGATINFVGPNTESDIADQVQMFNSAVNAKPSAIGLAALDTEACLDTIAQAQSDGIPIVGFDSGVPGAPEGAVVANASTGNYAAGEKAAEEGYKTSIKDHIANASGQVRIGVVPQDSVSESIVNRALGFIDKIGEHIMADGKTVAVTGNDKYVTDSKIEAGESADVVIEVRVPSQFTAELLAVEAQALLNQDDLICIYGPAEGSGEAIVTANANLNKLGTGDDQVIGIAFDSGAVIKQAIRDGILIGAITQAPVRIGEATVELCVKAVKGEPVEDIDTGCQWYTKDNMDDPEIAQNLYD